MHNDKMQSMFSKNETSGKSGEQQARKLADALADQQKMYDQQLFSDWVIRVYDKCAIACLHSFKS